MQSSASYGIAASSEAADRYGDARIKPKSDERAWIGLWAGPDFPYENNETI